MFGIGFPELVLILVVALVVFGPKQLPEVARSIGKGIREIKKATADITDLTDLDINSESKRARIAPNPANPNREMVAPLIKPEDENGEIIDAPEAKQGKAELVESTVADAQNLQMEMQQNPDIVPKPKVEETIEVIDKNK